MTPHRLRPDALHPTPQGPQRDPFDFCHGLLVPTVNARFFLPTLFLLLGLSASVAYSDEPELPVLRPEPVELEIPEVRGPQYLGADGKGRLVLVRGNRPEFHEILADGRVRPWGNAEDRQAVLDATVPGVLAASRSLDGRWLLAGPNQMLVVSRHKAETLPKLPLETLSVGFLNHPVAGVLPTIPSSSPAASPAKPWPACASSPKPPAPRR